MRDKIKIYISINRPKNQNVLVSHRPYVLAACPLRKMKRRTRKRVETRIDFTSDVEMRRDERNSNFTLISDTVRQHRRIVFIFKNKNIRNGVCAFLMFGHFY